MDFPAQTSRCRRGLNGAEPHLTPAGTPPLPHQSALSARSPSGRWAPTCKPTLVTWGPSHRAPIWAQLHRPLAMTSYFSSCGKYTKDKTHHFNHYKLCDPVASCTFLTMLCTNTPVQLQHVSPDAGPCAHSAAAPLPPPRRLSGELPVRGVWHKWSHDACPPTCGSSHSASRLQGSSTWLHESALPSFPRPGAVRRQGDPVLVNPSSADGHVGGFYLLAAVNGAAANEGGRVFVSTSAGSSLGRIRRRATARSVAAPPGRPAAREEGASVRGLG